MATFGSERAEELDNRAVLSYLSIPGTLMGKPTIKGKLSRTFH